ncbi:unnamed protein product [Protopolystoma xenopodis]|uniref:Uncharacterized protein n=1 Tax=Protopolystoma xenopodis TaxID=117903 RepID=A0A448WYJ0_9PLAT|nr:unnamed protein product [Protopolystoma xenopodis]
MSAFEATTKPRPECGGTQSVGRASATGVSASLQSVTESACLIGPPSGDRYSRSKDKTTQQFVNPSEQLASPRSSQSEATGQRTSSPDPSTHAISREDQSSRRPDKCSGGLNSKEAEEKEVVMVAMATPDFRDHDEVGKTEDWPSAGSVEQGELPGQPEAKTSASHKAGGALPLVGLFSASSLGFMLANFESFCDPKPPKTGAKATNKPPGVWPTRPPENMAMAGWGVTKAHPASVEAIATTRRGAATLATKTAGFGLRKTRPAELPRLDRISRTAIRPRVIVANSTVANSLLPPRLPVQLAGSLVRGLRCRSPGLLTRVLASGVEVSYQQCVGVSAQPTSHSRAGQTFRQPGSAPACFNVSGAPKGSRAGLTTDPELDLL